MPDSSPPSPAAPFLTVTGTGQIRLPPDRLIVSLEIEATRPTAELAQLEVDNRRDAILAALRQANVPHERIRASGVSLAPHYDYRDGRQIFAGIAASEQITVRVPHAPGRANEIVRALASELPRLKASVSHLLRDRSAPHDQALAAAVVDARRQAEAIAAATDSRLATLLEIVAASRDERCYEQIASAAPDAADHDDIAPHELVLEAKVTAKWTLASID